MSEKNHQFTRKQFLPIDLQAAWKFFSNPYNLPKITPASLDFKILSNPPDVVHDGLIIEYTVKPLLGIPMRWVSRIQDVKPLRQFVDEQIKGPYAYWHHLHLFEEVSGGVEMTDIVTYRVPLQNLFPWVKELIVEKELKRIFEYRRVTMGAFFPPVST